MAKIEGKILNVEALKRVSRKLRQAGKKIVTTNGTYDILHAGHILSLEEARSFGDVLIVGVNSNASTRSYKGPLRPIYDERERALMVAGHQGVDYVYIFDEFVPEILLRAARPHIHTTGIDWKGKVPEQAVCDELGIEIRFLRKFPGFSTTEVIRKIKQLPDA